MNKTELVDKVANGAGITKVDAEAAINAFIATVGDALKEGDKVVLKGFGTFEVRERKERVGRNPQTGEAVMIPASKTPAFKASTVLKKSVND
ncbi:MAG: HU family DNA-binding protein [Erysipelotrichaceae bacterium]|nr:HU family DNA-binding protein [Erysipelotrichaceae bacterium]